MGGNWSTWRNSMQTWGEHADLQQKGPKWDLNPCWEAGVTTVTLWPSCTSQKALLSKKLFFYPNLWTTVMWDGILKWNRYSRKILPVALRWLTKNVSCYTDSYTCQKPKDWLATKDYLNQTCCYIKASAFICLFGVLTLKCCTNWRLDSFCWDFVSYKEHT